MPATSTGRAQPLSRLRVTTPVKRCGRRDRIYGVSAGALNGAATAAGQAALSATHYQDAASGRMINVMRPLLRRPVVDFDLLFEEVIAARKPLSAERLPGGPEFRALATSIETLSLRVLAGFADSDELTQALRASASLPRLGGTLPSFRGERMADGGLIEPIPYETPLREGATHVLVLRSRPAGYRKPALSELGESLALRDDPGLAELYKARPAGRLGTNGGRVTNALRLGAGAMASMILTDAIDLCWQPVVYRAEPAEPPATRRSPAAG
ncbi:MAG TPA: patatin-like phospholipase family protein [Solirubrobacteraceae bacterium]|nr:patatin-like phospholipase family protein [Solirubrobacteraceae bacterium]